MIKTGFQNIFSVPIYTTFLDNKIIEYMEDLITPRLPQLKITNEKVKENVYTDFWEPKRIVNVKELSKLIKVVNPIFKKFSDSTSLALNSQVQFWIQDYRPTNSHPIHAHPGSFISGVYYIRANENAGEIEFFNPNPHSYFQKYTNPDSRRHNYLFNIKPKKGMLILFPSYLFHRVLSSFSSEVIRTCLAFNL